MPLALDPKQTFKIVLTSDEDKPDPKPCFIFRYLSNRDWKEIARIVDEVLDKKQKCDDVFSKVEGGIKRALVGWENIVNLDGVPIEYDPSRLDEIITPQEMWELLWRSRDGMSLSIQDKKKSELQSQSSTDDSVKIADQGDVKTNQAN